MTNLLAAVCAIAAPETFEDMLDPRQRQLHDPCWDASLAQFEDVAEQAMHDFGMKVDRGPASGRRRSAADRQMEVAPQYVRGSAQIVLVGTEGDEIDALTSVFRPLGEKEAENPQQVLGDRNACRNKT